MEILGAFFPLDPLTLYFMGVGRSAPLFLKARVKHILHICFEELWTISKTYFTNKSIPSQKLQLQKIKKQ